MPRQLFVPKGKWWRSDEYEIRDGFIAPAARSTIRAYDPWVDWEGQNKGPHVELAEIVSKYGPWPTSQIESMENSLAPKAKEELLKWCKDHGLLGVLSHETLSATLPPTRPDGARGPWTQEQFYKSGGRWHRLAFEPRAIPVDSESPAETGIPPPGWFEEPSVTLDRTLWLGSERTPPAFGMPAMSKREHIQYLARYFPAQSCSTVFDGDEMVREDTSKTHRYPMPLAVEFWRQYAEPLHEFFRLARLFELALRELAQTGKNAVPSGNAIIEKLSSEVCPTLTTNDSGTPELQWASPSLLGYYSMMALLDHTGRRRMYICPGCGRVSASFAYQAKYCEAKCRNKVNKAAERERKKKLQLEAGS